MEPRFLEPAYDIWEINAWEPNLKDSFLWLVLIDNQMCHAKTGDITRDGLGWREVREYG